MEILRFCVSGNVDDGKSTTIGRLMFDGGFLTRDQKENVLKYSKTKQLDHLDYSILTDGLFEERLQKITIDIAFRYFQSKNRKFVVVDTPGHSVYTRNMVTGASVCDLAVIMVDANTGVTSQTKQHIHVASLMGIRQLIFCINKMDLVKHDEAVFNSIRSDLNAIISKLNFSESFFIPVSALHGDNIVEPSQQMLWYHGKTLFNLLDSVSILKTESFGKSRFACQFSKSEYIFGKVNNGHFALGDEVIVFPTMKKSSIIEIILSEKFVHESFTGDSITIKLVENQILERGEWLIKSGELPILKKNFNAKLIWLGNQQGEKENEYLLMNTTQLAKVRITSLNYFSNLENSNQEITVMKTIEKNNICGVSISAERDLYFDLYKESKETGSFILCDLKTNQTVAAGIFE